MRQYPGWLVDKADQFPFAAANALNKTGEDLQKKLIDQGPRDLNFRVRHRPALGVSFPVSARATKHNLEACVYSDRGWITHQVQDGTLTPKRGIRYKGKSYLFIPNPKVIRRRSKAHGGRRRIRTGRGGKIFVLESRGQLILMLRFGPDASDLQPLGVLEPKAAFADDYDWDGTSNDVIDSVMPDHFEYWLARALASRR